MEFSHAVCGSQSLGQRPGGHNYPLYSQEFPTLALTGNGLTPAQEVWPGDLLLSPCCDSVLWLGFVVRQMAWGRLLCAHLALTGVPREQVPGIHTPTFLCFVFSSHKCSKHRVIMVTLEVETPLYAH